MNDVLICVTGHANTDDRKNFTINLLKSLKNENLNVCYLTHCEENLEEISKFTDYLYFDKNNLLIHSSDYINNSDLFDENSHYYGYHSAKNYQSFGEITLNQIPPHCPAVLILQKSAVNISFFNSFKWTVLIDYDLKVPVNGFRNLFQDKIDFLEKEGKKCLMYDVPNQFFNFACIMIFQSEKLFSNELLMKYDWYKSPRDWIKHFKLGFSELIMQTICENVFKSDIVKECLLQDSEKYWNIKNIHELTQFTYNGYLQFGKIIKIMPSKKKDGGFLLVTYLYNDTNDLLEINDLIIENKTKNTVLYEIKHIELQKKYWFFESLNEELFTFNDTLTLKYNILHNNGNHECVIEHYNLNTINKIHDHILRLEFKS